MENLLCRINDPDSMAILRSIGIYGRIDKMKAYLVGGPVRDLMLKSSHVDLDIAVEGNAMHLAAIFANGYKHVKLTRYPAFKTATVHLLDYDKIIDFTTARKEIYARPGAYPKVEPSNIKSDLFRRDFTVNAMAISLNLKTWGKLVDPFGGKEDLSRRRLRVLHEKSFVDDPTRILRLARFKARLGFKIEAATFKLLKSAIRMKVLDTIKPQRYLKDFNKILKEPTSKEAVKYLRSWNAYRKS